MSLFWFSLGALGWSASEYATVPALAPPNLSGTAIPSKPSPPSSRSSASGNSPIRSRLTTWFVTISTAPGVPKA